MSPGDVCLRRDCGCPSAPSRTAVRASICGSGRRQGLLLSCQSCHPSASKHRMGHWCRQSGAWLGPSSTATRIASMPCRSIGSNPSSPVRLRKDIASALPRLCSCVKLNQRNRKALSTRDVSVAASTAKVRPSRGRGGRGQCQACCADRAPRPDRGGRGRRRGPLRGHCRATGRCGLIRGWRHPHARSPAVRGQGRHRSRNGNRWCLQRSGGGGVCERRAVFSGPKSVEKRVVYEQNPCRFGERPRTRRWIQAQWSSGGVVGTIILVTIKWVADG